MARIIGLLSWFDEQPAYLERAIRSYHDTLGLTHIACLDGPYALYPTTALRSSEQEYGTLGNVADELGLDGIIDSGQVWQGNEIEKRTALFALGDRLIADPTADRFVVIDADEEAVPHSTYADVNECRDCVDERLARLVDVPTIRLAVRTVADFATVGEWIPKIFKATPGLHCADNHYTYVTPAGEVYWGSGWNQARCADMPEVEILHHTLLRVPERRAAADRYYAARGEAAIERPHAASS